LNTGNFGVFTNMILSRKFEVHFYFFPWIEDLKYISYGGLKLLFKSEIGLVFVSKAFVSHS